MRSFTKQRATIPRCQNAARTVVALTLALAFASTSAADASRTVSFAPSFTAGSHLGEGVANGAPQARGGAARHAGHGHRQHRQRRNAAQPRLGARQPAPCYAAFPEARRKTIGRTTWYNRQESVRMVICYGFVQFGGFMRSRFPVTARASRQRSPAQQAPRRR
jgi:hypothetical protein